MVKFLLVLVLCCGLGAIAAAHNIGATPVTWNREISRLVYDKCASCHRPGGTAFSMMTYLDVQPRLVEIKSAVLNRRMPPWGAIKGFGEFKNDQALTQEQIELIVDWIQNDAPRGNNRRALPTEPAFASAPPPMPPAPVKIVRGATTLDRALVLDGLLPERVASISRSESPRLFPMDRSSRSSGCISTSSAIRTPSCSADQYGCPPVPSFAACPMMPRSDYWHISPGFLLSDKSFRNSSGGRPILLS